MTESTWLCERCRREFDLERGQGWITLVDEEDSCAQGKLTALAPYEEVCYQCADELLSVVEKCDKLCHCCEVTAIWGLSIMDCLRFQAKFHVIEPPQKPRPSKGSLEEAREVLRIFDRF